MKLTRDSALVTVAFLAALSIFLGGHFELLTKAFPSIGVVWQARIELCAALSGFVAAYLKMSPLALDAGNPMATRDADQTLTVLGNKPKE